MYNLIIRGYGGTGRRVGLRIQWETMQVRFLLSTPKMTEFLLRHFFVCRNQTYGSPVSTALSFAEQPSFCRFATFPLPRESPSQTLFAFPLSRGRNLLSTPKKESSFCTLFFYVQESQNKNSCKLSKKFA